MWFHASVQLCLKAKMAFPHNLKNFKSESHTQCLCFFRRKALPEASQTPSKWFILLISYLYQVLHHGLSMFSIFLSLMSSQGQIYILMVLFSESTTPFVNIRWLVNNLKFVKSFFSLVHLHCLTTMTVIPGTWTLLVRKALPFISTMALHCSLGGWY